MTLTSKPAYRRPYRVFVKAGTYWLPKLLKDANMTLSNAEGRRMIKQRGGLWIDCKESAKAVAPGNETVIHDRLEKVYPFLDGEEIELKPGWAICVGRKIDDAACHRVVAMKEKG